MDYKIIGSNVKGKVDRPIGSKHPDFDWVYPINYGYVEKIITPDGEVIEGIIANDGEPQDVYIIGDKRPLEAFEGIVIAIYHRVDDNEDKWIVSVDERNYSDEEILRAIYFQEQYFNGDLIR